MWFHTKLTSCTSTSYTFSDIILKFLNLSVPFSSSNAVDRYQDFDRARQALKPLSPFPDHD